MDSQTVLINFLAGLGFEGPALEADLALLQERFPPVETIHHVINYGEAQMRYALNFEHDRQFNTYRLASFKASYRKPVHIGTKVYKAVNIPHLEELMRTVDWKAWFSARGDAADALTAENVHRQLDQLAEENTTEGIALRDLLRYKYFPAETLDIRLRKNMAFDYERERTFYASAAGIVDTNLAFHILNGNLDKLHESLMKTELEQFISIDIHSVLCALLSTNPAAFHLTCAKTTEEGTVSFNIPIVLHNGLYEPGLNTATFEPAESISHKKIAHVDTGVLEKQMAGIDWHNDNLYQIAGENIRLSADIERLDRTLTFLEQTKSGKKIAGQLKRKYWTGAPFFETLVPNIDHTSQKIVAEFSLDFPAKSIYNLLCCRPVIAQPLSQVQATDNEWLRITDIVGTTPHIKATGDGLTKEDLLLFTTALSIKEPKHDVINGLLQGDRVSVDAKTVDGYLPLQLEAMPENRVLKVYNTTGDTIPINFRLQTASEFNKDQRKGKTIGDQHKKSERTGKGIN